MQPVSGRPSCSGGATGPGVEDPVGAPRAVMGDAAVVLGVATWGRRATGRCSPQPRRPRRPHCARHGGHTARVTSACGAQCPRVLPTLPVLRFFKGTVVRMSALTCTHRLIPLKWEGNSFFIVQFSPFKCAGTWDTGLRGVFHVARPACPEPGRRFWRRRQSMERGAGGGRGGWGQRGERCPSGGKGSKPSRGPGSQPPAGEGPLAEQAHFSPGSLG